MLHRPIEAGICHTSMSDSKLKKKKSDSMSPGWVAEITPNDVLFGRCAPTSRHQGNLFFRDIVEERRAKYLSASRHRVKKEIAQEIIDEITSRNGRFVREIKTSNEARQLGIPRGTRAWVLVGKDDINAKVKQALRQPDCLNDGVCESNRSDFAQSMNSLAEQQQALLSPSRKSSGLRNVATGLPGSPGSESGLGINQSETGRPLLDSVISGNLSQQRVALRNQQSLGLLQQQSFLQNRHQLLQFDQQQRVFAAPSSLNGPQNNFASLISLYQNEEPFAPRIPNIVNSSAISVFLGGQSPSSNAWNALSNSRQIADLQARILLDRFNFGNSVAGGLQRYEGTAAVGPNQADLAESKIESHDQERSFWLQQVASNPDLEHERSVVAGRGHHIRDREEFESDEELGHEGKRRKT